MDGLNIAGKLKGSGRYNIGPSCFQMGKCSASKVCGSGKGGRGRLEDVWQYVVTGPL